MALVLRDITGQQFFELEVCMGMGNPYGHGIPVETHGNMDRFGAIDGNRNKNNDMGIGKA